jgi:hypothetical protein
MWRSKKVKKELAETRLLKLSKTSHIVTAFNRHNTLEWQMVAIVTVTMWAWESCVEWCMIWDKTIRDILYQTHRILLNSFMKLVSSIYYFNLKIYAPLYETQISSFFVHSFTKVSQNGIGSCNSEIYLWSSKNS